MPLRLTQKDQPSGSRGRGLTPAARHRRGPVGGADHAGADVDRHDEPPAGATTLIVSLGTPLHTGAAGVCWCGRSHDYTHRLGAEHAAGDPPGAGSEPWDAAGAHKAFGAELREPVGPGHSAWRKRLARTEEGDGSVRAGRGSSGGCRCRGAAGCSLPGSRIRGDKQFRHGQRKFLRCWRLIRAARLSALICRRPWPGRWWARPARSGRRRRSGPRSSWRSLTSPGAESTNSSITPPRTGWTWMAPGVQLRQGPGEPLKQPGSSRRTVRARRERRRTTEPPSVTERGGVEPPPQDPRGGRLGPPRSPGRLPSGSGPALWPDTAGASAPPSALYQQFDREH